jgi:hypothetical protein
MLKTDAELMIARSNFKSIADVPTCKPAVTNLDEETLRPDEDLPFKAESDIHSVVSQLD